MDHVEVQAAHRAEETKVMGVGTLVPRSCTRIWLRLGT